MTIADPKGLGQLAISPVAIHAQSNRLPDLLLHVPAVLTALRSIKRGQAVSID